VSFATSKEGLPLSFAVAPGNMHDSKLYVTTVQGIKVKQLGKKPLNKPKVINADAAYDSKKIREYNRKRGIRSNIPENRRNRKKGRKKRGRPYRMKKEEYKHRRSVERLFGWLKSFKRIAVRYEKLASTYTTFILLACILILWRVLK
jgi:transposase